MNVIDTIHGLLLVLILHIFRIKLLMNKATAPAFSLSKSLKKCNK